MRDAIARADGGESRKTNEMKMSNQTGKMRRQETKSQKQKTKNEKQVQAVGRVVSWRLHSLLLAILHSPHAP